MNKLCIALLLSFAGSLAACATAPTSTPLAGAEQLVLVTSAGWDAPRGSLRTFERAGDAWREIGGVREVTLGRTGSAWAWAFIPFSTRVRRSAKATAAARRVCTKSVRLSVIRRRSKAESSTRR